MIHQGRPIIVVFPRQTIWLDGISVRMRDIENHNQSERPAPVIIESWASLPITRLPLAGEPLCLEQTLRCGQAFRWHSPGNNIWEGVAGGRVWRLMSDGYDLLARAAPPLAPDVVIDFLSRYFALDLPVRQIQWEISRGHPAAAAAVDQFAGLRILRQEPLETILTFALATATNVPRLTRSIAELCRRFGQPLAQVEGIVYHDFPTLDALRAAPAADLFGPCNLGYRARSLQALVQAIQSRPVGWIESLGGLRYPDAHRALDDLPFLGPKVSDCICLFGLGHADAVPVDVHIWAIAHELFGEDIPTRTLTSRTYRAIGDRFRALFGPWAGWAQQYLFSARRAQPPPQRFRPGASPAAS